MSMVNNNIHKISIIISEEGFISFLFKVIRAINKNIFGITKTIIFELDLNNPGPDITPRIRLKYRLATKKDIDNLNGDLFDYNDKSKEYSKKRLEKGDRCILAIHNKKIVGYIWVMKQELHLSKIKIRLSKNRAYSYKAFVLKEYRGMRIQPGMYNYLIRLLKEDKKRYIVSTVDSDNKSSLRTKQRGGFKMLGSIYQTRFLGLKLDYLKKKTKYYLMNKPL